MAQRARRGQSVVQSADEELAEDWRTGGYPYKNLMSRKSYEEQKYLAGGAAEAAGLGQGNRADAW